MEEKKTKIVLDADVIIHFAKGGLLHLLPSIFPEHQFIVLDIVMSEIHKPTLYQLQRQMEWRKIFKRLLLATRESRRERICPADFR